MARIPNSTNIPGLICSIIVAVLGISTVTLLGNRPAYAETIVIEATDDATWKSGTNESDGETPIIVEVKRGDILEIRVPHGGHGFVTLKGPATPTQTENRDLVQVCGGQATDATVLQEVECKTPPDNFFGKNSRVGFTGTLKLKVTDKFKDDVNFWCTVHKSIMWGIVRLKP